MLEITIQGVYKGNDPRGLMIGGVPFMPKHVMSADVEEDVFLKLRKVSKANSWFELKTDNYAAFLQANDRPAEAPVKQTAAPKKKEEPVKEEPVKEEPVKEEPVKEEPVKEEPVKEEPVKEEPVKEEPVKEEPVKKEPVKSTSKKKTTAKDK